MVRESLHEGAERVTMTGRLRQWEVVDYCAQHNVLGWATCFPTPTEKKWRYVAKYVTNPRVRLPRSGR